jgi:hypothetical protein
MSSTQLPNELWIHVFEDHPDVLDLSDLNAIVRTNKTFHNLALRTLYRKVSWSNPFHLVNALKFWDAASAADSSSVMLPLSLTIGVSRMCASRNADIVDIDGLVASKPIFLERQERSYADLSDITSAIIVRSDETAWNFNIDYFASEPLHRSMLERACTFVNLEELAFTSVILPQSFHTFIHGFPHLQRLRLELCAIPATEGIAPSHTTLPITELYLFGLYYAVDMRYLPVHTVHNVQRNPLEFFTLASAQSLVELHVDSTAPVFTIFGKDGSPPVSQNLRRIFLHNHQPTRIEKAWKANGGSDVTRRTYDHTTIMLSMARLLFLCPSIQSIYTCYPFSETHFTTQLVTPQYFDSTNLRDYSGPIASFNFGSFATARGLRAIDITDDRCLLLQTIPKFGSEFTNLRVLSARFVGRWDNEVMYAVCALLPQLVRLKIVYSDYGPDDVGSLSAESATIPHLLTEFYYWPGTQFSITFNSLKHIPVLRSLWEDTLDKW